MYKYPGNTSKKNLDLNSKLKIFQIYKNLKYPSVNIDSYFQVYEEIFKNYIGKLCNAVGDEEVRKRLEKVDRFSCTFRCFKNGSPFICVNLKSF